MKDTKIKDPVKNIKYESSTTFTHGSDIYAVYRSKRAYPHYLIQFIYKWMNVCYNQLSITI